MFSGKGGKFFQDTENQISLPSISTLLMLIVGLTSSKSTFFYGNRASSKHNEGLEYARQLRKLQKQSTPSCFSKICVNLKHHSLVYILSSKHTSEPMRVHIHVVQASYFINDVIPCYQIWEQPIIYTWVERGSVIVKCSIQEHNTMLYW